MHKKLVSLLVLIPLLASVATADLIGYWPLDEGEGTVVTDASGNGNDGTVVGDATWVAGQLGRAMTFDGDGDYVDLGQKDAFNPTGSFSVSLWVNIGSWGGNWGNVMIGNRGEGGIGWQIRKNGGWMSTGNSNGISFTTRGVGFDDFGTTDVPPTGEWLHFAAVYNSAASTKTVYVNGVLDRTGVVDGGTIAATETNTFIGCRASGSNAPESFFTGTLDDIRLFSNALNADEVVALTLLPAASAPSPTDKATDVRPDSILSWRQGADVVTHNVYFGTSLEDVEAADVDSPLLVAQIPGDGETSYDPGILDLETTYYWRVDEVDSQGAIWAGIVWSFDSEAVTYDVTPDAVTATTTSEEGKGPENLINGSGLTDGAHDMNDLHMWTGNDDGNDVALEFEFDAVYKFANMQVWNYNLGVDAFLGFGVKDVTIEYAVDPNGEWTTLGDYEIPRASYTTDDTGTAVDLEGIVAQYIKINVNSNRNMTGTAIYGLSEVAFSYIPVLAREPEPADDSTGVAPDVVLAWRSGREVVEHQVHIGTDVNAVAAGEAMVDTVSVPTYAPMGLLLGQEYFWMITEVNDAATPTSWDSDVWSFETPDSIVVDDMESYDDDENRIYYAWIDGIDDSSKGGSSVAPQDPPYAEQDTVHSGNQSLSMQFGLGGASFSEATLTPAEPVDMTVGGAQTLVIWFRGQFGNPAVQLYAKVNGTTVNYTGSAASLAAPVWKQWNIDVSAMSSLSSLTLGVSGAGEGTVYFDDIALYYEADPQTGSAVDPGTDNLMAYYPMSGSLADATGNGYDGATDTGTFGDGPMGFGQAFVVNTDDANSYGTLDVGSLIETLGDSTFALWVNWAGEGSQWCRIFDFGTSTSNYVFLTPYASGNDLRLAIRTDDVGEQIVSRSGILSAGWHHIAVTFDSATMTITLYADGSAAASITTSLLPQDLGNTNQNYLGKSQYDNDPLMPGSVDDFRIYDRVLSAGEIQYLAGDR